MAELHPLIEMYNDYLNSEGDALNSYYEHIFLQHDKSILLEFGAQKYLVNAMLENIAKNTWNIKLNYNGQ